MDKLRDAKYAIYNDRSFILCHNPQNREEWILSGFVADFLQLHKEKSLIKRFWFNECEWGYLPITPSELDCAYSIENFCEYNGDVLKCVYGEEDHVFALHLGENEELCRRYGIGHVYDRYIGSRGYECFNDLWIVVPEDEVLDVWEQRSPIKGFPFHGPERVYVRKDGVWLR